MNSRCNNKNTLEYKDYWWRWIKVKRKKFEDFYDDMWSTYKDWLTIDRYPDNNGNYCKENCRRATMKEQQNNRRDNHILIYKWKKQTVAERSYELWINQQTILSRINYWFSIDKILNPSFKIINVK